MYAMHAQYVANEQKPWNAFNWDQMAVYTWNDVNADYTNNEENAKLSDPTGKRNASNGKERIVKMEGNLHNGWKWFSCA